MNIYFIVLGYVFSIINLIFLIWLYNKLESEDNMFVKEDDNILEVEVDIKDIARFLKGETLSVDVRGIKEVQISVKEAKENGV